MLHPLLQNFECVFFGWVDSIMTQLDNYNERESRAAVLLIENLDVNVCKLKKILS